MSEFNIDTYTISDLFTILDIDIDEEDEEEEEDIEQQKEDIIEKTNEYIIRFDKEGKTQLSLFFNSVQTTLLKYLQEKQIEQQTNEWVENEVLSQDTALQKSKITDRKQKIDVYDNEHAPMNREQLGINDTYSVPVKQDTLNPNLENTTSRFINLDSQFRQSSAENLSTDYTMDLSDSLTDVLSLRLYSIQIPFTWYAVDSSYGNTCMWITNKSNTFKLTIESGNYSSIDFCTTMNNSLLSLGFEPPPLSVNQVFIQFNAQNGKITLNLNGWTDPLGNTIEPIKINDNILFNPLINPYYTFYDVTGVNTCIDIGIGCSLSQGHVFDETLGWIMGFREPLQPMFSEGNTPSAVLNLIGTKYFIVVLDDYNQNHINNGLITIAELSTVMSMPNYYNASQPYICTNGDELNGINKKIPQVVPSAPRTLTRSQIYTVNEIIKSRNKLTQYRSKAPTNSDTFAIIPIKYGSMSTGQMMTELSGQFQDNKRIYFGPVDIDRMRIRLLNDKGNLVNLHGADWCVTLIADVLYQY